MISNCILAHDNIITPAQPHPVIVWCDVCVRALGRHLHSSSQRLELDVEQWKRHSAELSTAAEAERKEWNAKQEEVAAQMTQIRELLEMQVA